MVDSTGFSGHPQIFSIVILRKYTPSPILLDDFYQERVLIFVEEFLCLWKNFLFRCINKTTYNNLFPEIQPTLHS